MGSVWSWIRRRGDQAASLVEYAFLVTLIAIACLAAMSFLGNEASSNLDRSADTLSVANDAAP